MERRKFIYKASLGMVSVFGAVVVSQWLGAKEAEPKKKAVKKYRSNKNDMIEKLELSKAEWKERLSAEEYDVLREEGTERPFTSVLNKEKRKGVYHCRGCDLELFTSDMKFDSGTGWPSFFTHLEGRLETKTDLKLVYPRKEYHCARCGGHHGHVFKDGPAPTKQRWCNNGVALKFVPEADAKKG